MEKTGSAMMEEPVQILERLRRKWIFQSRISTGMISLAIGIILGEILHRLFDFSYGWIFLFSLLAFIFFLVFSFSRNITTRDLSRWLDAKYPFLEESSALLLTDHSAAQSSLQKIQARKTGERLQHEYQQITFPPVMNRALRWLSAALILFVMSEGINYIFSSGKIKESPEKNHIVNQVSPLPSISFMQIRISPPAYTRIHSRLQDQGDILAEEGSMLEWEIKTDRPIDRFGFIFNDSAKIFLQPKNPGHTEWAFHKTLQQSGFYQLMIDSQISEHYKMEMIRDLYPEIEIESPKPKTVLEYGMAGQIPLKVSICDDYGILSAGIYATISSGSGEAVKFSEKQIQFSESFREMHKYYALQRIIDLNKLGMIPGDELYFYIRAKDNHGQEKKSGVVIVALADTAELMSTELAVSGLNIKPEYFRSERQIILETQQLLAERHNLSAEAFKNKSNDLGVDQKMLRLRYGKFLGEEEESNELGAADRNAVNNPSNFGNADVVLDTYTDKHDNAADASFFEKDTKEQLRATLTEMWNAELQLRVNKPEAALPFEYKALRLLKDLQQKSRVYVAKTGYKTTALDPEKRLTGEQGKIGSPVEEQNAPENTGAGSGLREALGILQAIKTDSKLQALSLENLQEAEVRLREKAMSDPSQWLPAYGAIQKIIRAIQAGTHVGDADIRLVQNALQELIKPIAETPSRPETGGAEDLSDYYFRNLKKSP